jgi:hypothetical protein
MIDSQIAEPTRAKRPISKLPHILLIIPRGEAVRNFLYSDTLPVLSQQARVTILSVLTDDKFMARFQPYVEEIIPLPHYPDPRSVAYLRNLLHEAHFRWLWSEVAKNRWETKEARAKTVSAKVMWALEKASLRPFANRPILEIMTEVERYASYAFRQTNTFNELFARIQPDLVFNGSHIHGPAGRLPIAVAHKMGIPTAGFIFSWDNLTSRSRIFEPYDYYLVWHEHMCQQLLSIYPRLDPQRVFITGTPQFDFHFKPEFMLSREELCQRIGIDPERPFIFYTTGIAKHFPEEHKHVEFVARYLQEGNFNPKPQLVVRTYVKGTSPEMKALAAKNLPDVIFPSVQWDDEWFMPMFEDLAVYSSCLRHAAMGINAASTVSLELLMFDKPVMNLGFDPPGSLLPHAYRWQRHIEFDHYRPVAESGGVMVAYSTDDVRQIINKGLGQPWAGHEARERFINQTLTPLFMDKQEVV